MPVSNPPAVAASNVSIDGEGYIVIAGGPPPFKVEITDLGGGVHRYDLVVKDGAADVVMTSAEAEGMS